MKFLIPKNMQENLRVFSKKIFSTLKNSAYILIPVIMLLSVGIIALTQEDPFQVNNFPEDGEESGQERDFSSVYGPERVIPGWVKPARWFRSNSGGMPLEEVKSRITAMRGEYALVIDFTGSSDLPEHLLDYYDDNFFIEIRTLFKEGRQDRTQWIFRDENYGVRLIAVLFEAQEKAALVEEEAAADSGDNVIQNTEDDNITEEVDIASVQDGAEVKRRDPASGFIEIYDEKYHLTTEYRYNDKGEKTKIEYFYNKNLKTSAQAMLWDDNKEEYINNYTDYYRYNRSSFLRAVERVFLRDQQLTAADNIVKDNADVQENKIEAEENNIVKVSFPQNIISGARNRFFMGERFNAYPEFFGDLLVLKDTKLIYSTDEHGRVLEQTLIGNDENQTVIWKIVNTWSNDRIVKITKTEGETVLLAEYEYSKNGERVLERNIKDGVLERVVRTDGKTDIEELYLDNKLVLRAVWEDGRKISETRVTKN